MANVSYKSVLRLAALFVAGLAAIASSEQVTTCMPRFARTAPATGFLTKTIKVDGIERRYVVYVPIGYDKRRAWPTIVFLNGGGECGTDGLLQVSEGLGPAVLAHSERWPFLILFPQKPAGNLQWIEMDRMVMSMLDATKRRYNVDPRRIYLTGLSQGGEGTWRLGAKHADLWAAIAPICGQGDVNDAAKLKTLPIWAFHGEIDDVAPVEVSRTMVKAVKDAGGDCVLTTYPNVSHEAWINAYGESGLERWFSAHARPDRKSAKTP